MVVIDAKAPEEAEATAAGLAAALATDHVHFRSVSRPDSSTFFKKEGLLFLDPKQLDKLLEKTINAQPFLGQMAKDPSARGLFAALGLLGKGLQQGQVDLKPYDKRWPGSAERSRRPWPVIRNPCPGPGCWVVVLPNSAALTNSCWLSRSSIDTRSSPAVPRSDAIRAAAAKLEFVKSGDARVRITGNVALADEEFASVAEGTVAGLAGSIVLISLWLFLAVAVLAADCPDLADLSRSA